MEEERLDCLPSHFKLLKMDNDFDVSTERECFSCFYDLHLSAVGCECSPDRYSCLKHANLFCSCEMDKRFVMLRYNINELNKLLQALEGESLAIEAWANKNFRMVSADANEVCIDKQDMERDKGLEEGESSAGCGSSKDRSNLNASTSPNSHVTREMMQSESHLVTFSASNGSIVIYKDKVDQAGSLDLNLDDISGENKNYKGVSVEEKVCCSETRKEQENMELVGVGDQSHSFSVLKTEFSSCSRDVHNSCISDGRKYEVDQLMDLDSRKKPDSVFKKEVIDTPNTSIALTDESCLLQMFGTSVKLISLGSVVPGKLWCSKHAMYPKGMS